MQVFGQAYVVCRESKAEAERFVQHYVHELGDWQGVRNLLDMLIPNSQSALGEQWEAMAGNITDTRMSRGDTRGNLEGFGIRGSTR